MKRLDIFWSADVCVASVVSNGTVGDGSNADYSNSRETCIGTYINDYVGILWCSGKNYNVSLTLIYFSFVMIILWHL